MQVRYNPHVGNAGPVELAEGGTLVDLIGDQNDDLTVYRNGQPVTQPWSSVRLQHGDRITTSGKKVAAAA